tara:strand:+ start:100 stop:339 length:240 start_codon:yes stop_codon:yes gene_type:complete
MFNNKGESKMEKTIIVVRRSKWGSVPVYYVEKSAQTLEEAMKYKIALELLNDQKEITYVLFNELGQFEIDRMEKINETK